MRGRPVAPVHDNADRIDQLPPFGRAADEAPGPDEAYAVVQRADMGIGRKDFRAERFELAVIEDPGEKAIPHIEPKALAASLHLGQIEAPLCFAFLGVDTNHVGQAHGRAVPLDEPVADPAVLLHSVEPDPVLFRRDLVVGVHVLGYFGTVAPGPNHRQISFADTSETNVTFWHDAAPSYAARTYRPSSQRQGRGSPNLGRFSPHE